jgi:hypothetical protein
MKYLYSSISIFLALAPQIAKASQADNALNPLGNVTGASELYGRILRSLLGIAGIVALAFFIIGGIILLSSGGNQEKVKTGKNTLVWAIIGLFVAFSSYILLKFILEIIIGIV